MFFTEENNRVFFPTNVPGIAAMYGVLFLVSQALYRYGRKPSCFPVVRVLSRTVLHEMITHLVRWLVARVAVD